MKNELHHLSVLLILSIVFFVPINHAVAQETMNIHKKDKLVISIPVSDIEMITFSGSMTAKGNTIKDIDGNVYQTIQIGSQEWMAENLKTTRLNNGTAIELVTDNKDWYSMKTPAYCWYNNDEAINKSKYGALYNWYTVNTGNLCPSGWHVSSDNDWQILEKYLIANGHNSNGSNTGEIIGKSLAAKTGWTPSTGQVDVGSEFLPEYKNKSGFTGVPGGFRTNNGAFSSPSEIGAYWWTSKERDVNSAWFKYLINYRGTLEEIGQSKYFGCSVRCVKN